MEPIPVLPLVSVILPVRNEGEYLPRALDSVIDQDYPSERIEILIADGRSTDGTRQIIEEYQEKVPSLSLIDNPGLIVPKGMNLAMRKAKGDIFIRVDGHCEIASDYVRRCVGYLQRGLADGVGGSMETIGETRMAKVIAFAMSSVFGVGNSAFRTLSGKTMLVDTVPFPAYKRSVCLHAGGYDEELVRNQDDEYNYRLRELGYRILLAPDVHSAYYSRSTFRSLWRQFFQYGYWKVRVLQKHPRQMSLRQFAPVGLVSSILISLIFSLFSWQGLFLMLLITGVYLGGNIIASVITASKRGWETLLLLPVAFATIHFAYGCGFLIGLIKFAHRWRAQKDQVPELIAPIQGLNPLMKPKGEPEIRQMQLSDIPEIAMLHREIFPNSRSTRLGWRYLRKMYRWFLEQNPRLCLVAEQEGRIVGYVVGALAGYGRRIFRYAIMEVIFGLLVHPPMWFKKETFSLSRSYLKAFSPVRVHGQNQPVKEISISLADIGVAPSARGQGIGLRLVRKFEDAAGKLGAAQLTLSVDMDNLAARITYERCGWYVDAEYPERNSVHYSKLL